MGGAAELQLRKCMKKANVLEAALGLPLSIARMTGEGKFFDVQRMREQTCYSMFEWLESRVSFYSVSAALLFLRIGRVGKACAVGGETREARRLVALSLFHGRLEGPCR